MPGFTSVTFQQGGMASSSGNDGGDFGGGLGKLKKKVANIFKRTKSKKKDLGEPPKPKKSTMDRIKSVKDGMKNKSFSEIKKNAPDSKTAKKEIAKEVGKRVVKKTAKSALEAGTSYTIHLLEGGEPLTAKDWKDISTDASVGIVKKGLNGNLDEKTIGKEMHNSYNRVIQRRGGKPVKSFSKSMERIAQLRKRLHSAHNIRHRELHGDRTVLAIGPKPFGSGKMPAGKKGKKPKKKKPKKKKPKKKPKKKKSGKNGKKSKKFNVMKNVQSSRQMRDVFDV